MYHDHHLHPFGYAAMINGLTLMDAPDLDSMLSRVAEHADRVEGAVIGQRLNDEGIIEKRLPTAADIDDVVSDRPVLLYRYCGHIAVANSAALKLAGIDADTEDPAEGSFDRDAGGRPNGIIREIAITQVAAALEGHITPPTDLEIISALAGLRRMGIGSITGMLSVSEAVWCGVDDEVATLIRLGPDLPIDIDVLLITRSPEQFHDARQRIERAEGPIRFSGYKDFMDGSLGGHTASMYEPFADRPETRGMERFDGTQTRVMAEESLRVGGVVAIHAIGDRANDLVLDLQQSLLDDGADPERMRIEHASVLLPETIERMARMRVTASVQPAFIASEYDWLHKRLGDERMANAYPFRSMLEAGIPLLGGSDAPVELPDPEVGIRAAVDRMGLNDAEALTREQAEALFAPPAL